MKSERPTKRQTVGNGGTQSHRPHEGSGATERQACCAKRSKTSDYSFHCICYRSCYPGNRCRGRCYQTAFLLQLPRKSNIPPIPTCKSGRACWSSMKKLACRVQPLLRGT